MVKERLIKRADYSHMDNNNTERMIRQLVRARNNFMFSDTVKGAESLCMHFSIIQTAILDGVEPYDYYCKLFKELPDCQIVNDYEKLVPWNLNINPNHLQANA